MGFIGNDKNVISSSYLFAQLQTLYTKIKGLIDKKSDKSHTHKYAGSSTAGGSATSAVKLDTATAGSATQPVYFSSGKPTACTYTLGKSVPSDAKFTDTNTWRPVETVLSKENLNNITTPGFYSAGGGNTVTNKPSGVEHFGLVVIHRASGSYYTQIIFNDTASYRRFCVNGTWKSWVQDKLTDTNTWRGIQNNLTSDSTTDSLSAKQGKELKGLVDSKANSNHTHSYIPLSGSTSITGQLRSNSEIQSTNANAFRLVYGDYGTILRNDGNATYVLLTKKGDPYGGWNDLRPLIINNSDGSVSFNNGISGNLNGNASSATNADTLDGYHGDSYMLNIGYGSGYFNSMDVNNWTRSGSFATQSGMINLPEERGTDTWGTMLIISGLSDRVSQYVVFWNENDHPIWIRHLNGTTWTQWVKLTPGTSSNSNALNSTGFGNWNFTYYQTDGTFDGNNGWTHYLICNYADSTLYHYNIGLPFWGTPIYKRKWDGGDSGWQKFYTSENITYGTGALTSGVSALATGNIYIQYE